MLGCLLLEVLRDFSVFPK